MLRISSANADSKLFSHRVSPQTPLALRQGLHSFRLLRRLVEINEETDLERERESRSILVCLSCSSLIFGCRFSRVKADGDYLSDFSELGLSESELSLPVPLSSATFHSPFSLTKFKVSQLPVSASLTSSVAVSPVIFSLRVSG